MVGALVTHRRARRRIMTQGREDVVEQRRPGGPAALDEPLPARDPAEQRAAAAAAAPRASGPRVSAPAWLACAASAARFAAGEGRTSTPWVSSARGRVGARRAAGELGRQPADQRAPAGRPAAAAPGRRWPPARPASRPARRRGADPVHLDVVGVAVAAGGVVDGQHVGALLAQDRGQPLGGHAGVGAGERAARRAGRPAGHPGVGVARATPPGRTPSASAAAPQLARRRRAELGPVPRPSAASPASPPVATTSTTRCPSAAARASVPPVSNASSSGCAWNDTSVYGTATHLPGPGPTVALVRVAHVSDAYLPRLGGIEAAGARPRPAPAGAGHDAEVVTATPEARHDRTTHELVDGVPVHRVTVDLPYELPVHPHPGREVLRVVEEGRFDAVHLHFGVIAPFVQGAAPSLVRAGVPLVFTVHSLWGPAARLFRGRTARGLEPLAGRLHRGLRRGRGTDPLGAGRPRRGGRPAERHRPGVLAGPDPTRPTRSSGDGDGEVLLVSAMRLAPRKRPLPLLEILRAVRERVPAVVPLRAVIAGEGPQRAAMERYLERHRLPWVELPGRLAPAALRDLYHRADLYLSPGELEAFGIAALEARTAGLPVLARAGTGVSEFVEAGVEGVVGTLGTPPSPPPPRAWSATRWSARRWPPRAGRVRRPSPGLTWWSGAPSSTLERWT